MELGTFLTVVIVLVSIKVTYEAYREKRNSEKKIDKLLSSSK